VSCTSRVAHCVHSGSIKKCLSKHFALVCFLLLTTTTALAVDPAKHISQYAHSAWRTREGVFAGPVVVAQTADGYLWVGTNVGLVRFDGVRFIPWEPRSGQRLSDPRVFALVGGREGSLWVGTGRGIYRLKNGELTRYPQITGRIESVVEDAAGTVWLVRTQPTDEKGPLCSIKNDQVQCYGTANGVPFPLAINVQSGSAGELWISGYDELCRWATSSSTSYFGHQRKRPETFASLKGIATSTDGSVWAVIDQSKSGFQLQHFQHGAWSAQDLPAIAANNADVTTLFVDRDNMLWVGTTHHGIWRIRGNEVDHFDSTDGLSSDAVGRIYQDAEGSIWAVTSEGIDNFRDLRVTSFSTREGLSGAAASSVMARRDGSVWIGNFEALNALRDNTISGIHTGHGLPGLNVTTLLEDHAGRLWVGIDNGLWVYDKQKFLPIGHADGTPLGIVFAIAEDHHSIWVRAGPNLDRIDDLKLTSEVTSPQISRAYTLADNPRGGLILGSVNGDLLAYDDGKTTLFPAQGTDTAQVRDLLVEPDGSIWGTTLDSVFRYKGGQRKNLTERNGLPCDGIFALVKDRKDSLWLYSRCGLMVIAKSELEAWWDHPDKVVKFDLFDTADGASPGLTSLKPQTARSADGRLWFVNGRLLQVIDPDRLHLNNLPPPVHIEEVVADRKSYGLQGTLRLPPRIRDLEIEYTALSFVAPQKVRFRYKLEGHDENWQDPGPRREAFYTDLSPGHYTFRVLAANNEGVWNETGATLDFDISPAWFQTNWFRAFCVACALFIVWAIYQFRLRRVTKELSARFDERLAERTRIARELHDTLLQTIQGSKMVAEVALENSDDPVRTRSALERLSEWLGVAAQEGRAALNSLRTSTTEMNNLSAAFRQALDECRRETSMEAGFSVTGDARAMHPVVRDEIYRIGYEAIRNACKHSAGSRVEVALSYVDDLSLRVRDNGLGIDPAVIETGRSGHFGLQGMRERAARIGARLTITASANSGTDVKLVVPGRIVFQKPRTTPIDKVKTILKRSDDD
jgi:signal transduction histidine kinase/ligand-binding sensor domain-containing protein